MRHSAEPVKTDCSEDKNQRATDYRLSEIWDTEWLYLNKRPVPDKYHPNMIWLQGAICFLLWISYGVLQSRRSQAILSWACSMPKPKRIGIATLFMIGSFILMFGVLLVNLQLKGFTQQGMTAWACILVGLVGLIFVHGQTMATALLLATLQESVTGSRSNSSTPKDSPEIRS